MLLTAVAGSGIDAEKGRRGKKAPIQIRAPSGRVYTWQKPGSPTAADIAHILKKDAQRPALGGSVPAGVATYSGGIGAPPADFSRMRSLPGRTGPVAEEARKIRRSPLPKQPKDSPKAKVQPSPKRPLSETEQAFLDAFLEMPKGRPSQGTGAMRRNDGSLDWRKGFDQVVQDQKDQWDGIQWGVHTAAAPLAKAAEIHLGALGGGRFSDRLEAAIRKLPPESQATFELFRMGSPLAGASFVRDITAKAGVPAMAENLRTLPQRALVQGDEQAQVQFIALVQMAVAELAMKGFPYVAGLGEGSALRGLPAGVKETAWKKLVREWKEPSPQTPGYRERGGFPIHNRGGGRPHSNSNNYHEHEVPFESWDDLPGEMKIWTGTHKEFVPGTDGSYTIGNISKEIAKEAGIEPGRIRLQRGETETFGREHIRRKSRSDQIKGYFEPGPDKYIEAIAKGFDGIIRSGDRLLLTKKMGHQQILVIELVGNDSGGGYTIVSAYPVKPTQPPPGPKIWPKSPRRNRQ